jgi:hypothetical protein
MNSIDTRILIGGMTSVGAGSQSDSHPGKLPVKDTLTQSGPNTQPSPVQTDVSFPTYGSNNEHLAVVVAYKKREEIIRDIPAKEVQRLHVYLEAMV